MTVIFLMFSGSLPAGAIHQNLPGQEQVPYLRQGASGICQGVHPVGQIQIFKRSKGDYIAVREDDLSDVYTIEKSVFLRSYERCE